MTDAEFSNEVLARLEDIRALYKKHCPKAFVEGDDQSGYLSLTIFNDAIFFGNGSRETTTRYGINRISGFRRINE